MMQKHQLPFFVLKALTFELIATLTSSNSVRLLMLFSFNFKH